MISTKQKIALCILSLIATLLAVIVLLPFDVLCARLRWSVENIKTIELVIKLIVMPLAIIGLSIYPILLRRRNYYTQLDVSVAATKMSFIPTVVYLCGLFGWLGNVIYASVRYEKVEYLVTLTAIWCSSVLIMFVFGIFTKWLSKLTGKQMLFANILTLLVSILIVVGCLFVYKSLPEIKNVKENNAFLQMMLYMCLFMLSILTLWKSVFNDESAPVVLERDEEFTEEEINEIIVSHVDEDVLQSFDEYYFVNRGKYLEALKQQQEVKEELEDQQYEE